MDAATPLYVKPITKNGKQCLEMWLGNNKTIVAESPLLPYLYSKKSIQDSLIHKVSKDSYKLMSDDKLHELYKYEFLTLHIFEEFKTKYNDDCIDIGIGERYIDAIVQHYPTFFKQYPSKDIQILTFDIEQATDGTKFPTAKDTAISIAWAINEEEEQQEYSNGFNDEQLVYNFANLINKRKFDVIVGYNHCKYDLPRMIEKFDLLGIPNHIWGKNDKQPFFYEKKIGPNTMVAASSAGTLFYDVFHAALTDQTLNGKKRSLKSVSQHYAKDLGINKIIKVDTKNTVKIMGTPELREYNICDVTNTRILFNFYFSNVLAMAQFIGAPLNRLVPLATTYGFTQVLGNIFFNEKIVANTNNHKKYPWAFENLGTYINEDGEEEDQKPYQGATSACYKLNHLAFDLVEEDVNSLYPAIMAGLGIGPDNTRIIGTAPLSDFKVIQIGKKRIYNVPDTVRNWNWIIEVTGFSKVAKIIDEYLVERLRIKKMSKADANAALYAIAYAMKVNLNSSYGLSGSEFIPFGELGVAVLTTFVGRKVIEEGRRFVGESIILYVDTDSLKYPRNQGKSKIELNNHFSTWFKEVMLGRPGAITWDEKPIPAAFFKQDKSYILLNEKGHLELTGGAFKSTKYSNIFNKVIEDIGYVLLTKGINDARNEARKWIKLEAFPKEDFIMEVRVGKPINEYKSKSATAPSLALKTQERMGIEPYVGQTINYVKTSQGYDLVTEQSLNNLDKKYYLQIVIDALERMNLKDVISKNEFEYLTLDKKQNRLDMWL